MDPAARRVYALFGAITCPDKRRIELVSVPDSDRVNTTHKSAENNGNLAT